MRTKLDLSSRKHAIPPSTCDPQAGPNTVDSPRAAPRSAPSRSSLESSRPRALCAGAHAHCGAENHHDTGAAAGFQTPDRAAREASTLVRSPLQRALSWLRSGKEDGGGSSTGGGGGGAAGGANGEAFHSSEGSQCSICLSPLKRPGVDRQAQREVYVVRLCKVSHRARIRKTADVYVNFMCLCERVSRTCRESARIM